MHKDVSIMTLIEFGRRLYDRSLVIANQGNLSVRDKSGLIHITAAGTCLGRLEIQDAIEVDERGAPRPGQKEPSSEYRIHVAAYRNRPDVKACCHAHPPHATAIGVTGTLFPQAFLPEAIIIVGRIAMVEYATPGSDRLAENLEKHLEGHNAFILKNHGVLTMGRNMEEAFVRMEMVENLARIAYIASAFGEIDPLVPEEILRLEKIGKSLSSDRSADD